MLPAAIAINALLGVLYGWSLFLSPIEAQLLVSRTVLSFVPAMGLLCFTLGVLVHNLLIPRLQIGILAPGVVATAGLGHFLFWLFPSYIGLLLGYGVVFGTTAGIGYGLALAMARQSSPTVRGWAVGVTVAAFAASGMAISALGAIFQIQEDVPRLFGFIGAVFCISAMALASVLRRATLAYDSSIKLNVPNTTIPVFPLLYLALGYFALCYPGLVFVSHGAAILQASGASDPASSIAPFILNAGYIAGALLGGFLPSCLPGRGAPLVLLIATTTCVGLMKMPLPIPFHVLAMFGIGVGLGSVVSVFFLLLSHKYNPDRASALFARLNISYGLAGISAPTITGRLYDLTGGSDATLWFTFFVGIVGLIAISNTAAARSIT